MDGQPPERERRQPSHVNLLPCACCSSEMSAFMKKASIKAQVEWSPRSGNAEAAALANGNFLNFYQELRRTADPEDMGWEQRRRAGDCTCEDCWDSRQSTCERKDAQTGGAHASN